MITQAKQSFDKVGPYALLPRPVQIQKTSSYTNYMRMQCFRSLRVSSSVSHSKPSTTLSCQRARRLHNLAIQRQFVEPDAVSERMPSVPSVLAHARCTSTVGSWYTFLPRNIQKTMFMSETVELQFMVEGVTDRSTEQRLRKTPSALYASMNMVISTCESR